MGHKAMTKYFSVHDGGWCEKISAWSFCGAVIVSDQPSPDMEKKIPSQSIDPKKKLDCYYFCHLVIVIVPTGL